MIILKGKHSIVKILNNKVIKTFHYKLNFWKEVKYLSLLQPFEFVPKIYKINSEKLEIEMEYIKGISLSELIKNGNYKEILEILEKSMDICYLLDKLKIQKCEMNHPDKHIIISNSKPIFIDFERAYETNYPKNLTQFTNYIIKILNLWENLENLIELLKKYKRNYEYNNYLNIKNLIFSQTYAKIT